MKIYIVFSSFGQYEDHYRIVEGVYTNPASAELETRRIKAVMEEALQAPCPIDDSVDAILSKEGEKMYCKWSMAQSDAEEYNASFVQEEELIED